jgi:hypothetical protein
MEARMGTDQGGFTGRTKSEPGFHYHNGNAYLDQECACELRPATIDNVKAHALKHYDEGGWDVVVEAMSDKSIQETLMMMDAGGHDFTEPCITLKDATEHSLLRVLVSVWADRQADARNSVF